MGDGFARRRVALEEVAAVGTGDGPMTCAASDEEGLAGGDVVVTVGDPQVERAGDHETELLIVVAVLRDLGAGLQVEAGVRHLLAAPRPRLDIGRR